jgi:hypothetical protein
MKSISVEGQLERLLPRLPLHNRLSQLNYRSHLSQLSLLNQLNQPDRFK